MADNHGPEAKAGGLIRALGSFQATAINMSQMVGIGPFITIPLILTTMGGPQAIFGWIVGALLAMADGLVWSELGASMPSTGGSYIYLRQAYQYYVGKLAAFLFVWSTLIVTPLTMSTGTIGMADYLAFFWPHMTLWDTRWVAVAITGITVVLLYRRIDSVGRITQILWGGMIVTVIMVIFAAATHFHPNLAFHYPPGALTLSPKFFQGLGAGLVIAIYDYLGYFTSAYLGDEVKDPGRVIPRSIVMAIIFVALIDLSMNIGMIGVVPWQVAAKSKDIGTLFMQRIWGNPGAIVLTLLILWTAFASVFTGLLGGSRLPYNAARDRLFFASFGRLHPKLQFPHVALLVMGVFTAFFSFFNLSTIISALMAVSIVVQFMGQIVGLSILRVKQPGLNRPFRQWLYPIPSIIAFIGWAYVFVSSGWLAIRIAIIWTLLGFGVFLFWAHHEKVWPFGPKEIQEPYLHPKNDGGQTT